MLRRTNQKNGVLQIMKWKEYLGIGLGILFFAVAFVSCIISSKDDQAGRTEPVAQYAWNQVVFKDAELNKVIEDLQVKNIKGFLFRKDSQTPIYTTVYVGKSAKGSDAVKAYFPDAKEVEASYKSREESALKILGVEKPVLYTGKKIRNDIEITFMGDYVIITFSPESTDKILDKMQMLHFLHRYFKEIEPEDTKKEEKKVEQPAKKKEKKDSSPTVKKEEKKAEVPAKK